MSSLAPHNHRPWEDTPPPLNGLPQVYTVPSAFKAAKAVAEAAMLVMPEDSCEE